MERNPLQTVAMTKVTKLNHMVGIAKICIIEIFLVGTFLSSFDCSFSLLWLFPKKEKKVNSMYINFTKLLKSLLKLITYAIPLRLFNQELLARSKI